MAESYVFNVNTGVIIPDASNIQQEVENDYKNAFGADLIVTPDTPQGILITLQVLARLAVARNNSQLANQLNPNLAGGVFFDAIWALTGGQRPKGSPSTISNVELSGVAGTLVEASKVLCSNGDVDGPFFKPLNDVIIGPAGSAFVDFVCTENGPNILNVGALTTIVTGVLGLETVNNENAAVPGATTLSDVASHRLRKQSLALQGSSLAEAVMSQVAMTPLVESQSFRENKTDEILVIDGVTMKRHSLFSCVFGGADLDVATAIASKKSGGCNYSDGSPTAGGTPVTIGITDPSSLQTIPVTFVRPDEILILIRATVKIKDALGDPTTQVKKAIMDYVNGELPGQDGFVVGAPVSCFELAGAIAQEVPQLFVKKVETALDEGPIEYSTDEIPIALWEVPITSEDAIVVVVE